jgi:hypothetical protein
MGSVMAEKPDNVTEICEAIQPQLAAYAIGDGALDAPIRAHLLICSACQQILHDYSHVVQILPFDAPVVSPPAALRERLIAAVAAEVAPPPHLPAPTPTRASTPPAPPRQRRWPLFGVWGALGAALIAIVVLFGWNIALQQQLATQTTALTASREGWQSLVVMMNDPTLVSYRMSGSVAHGTLWGVPQREIACLMIEDLPAPPSGQIYQVWLQTATGWSSVGIYEFRPGSRWFMIRPTQAFGTYSAVLVTTEPAGGSQTPSGPALIQSDLTIRT